MRTVVACPVGKAKAYSLADWAAATVGYDRFMVTDEVDFADEVEGDHGIPCYIYEAPPQQEGVHPMYRARYNAAMRCILRHAEGRSHILSLESDVIPPEGCDILALMEEHYTKGLLCHGYPWRAEYNRPYNGYEMGCTLGSVEEWASALMWAEANHQSVYGAVRQVTHTDIDLVQLRHE